MTVLLSLNLPIATPSRRGVHDETRHDECMLFVRRRRGHRRALVRATAKRESQVCRSERRFAMSVSVMSCLHLLIALASMTICAHALEHDGNPSLLAKSSVMMLTRIRSTLPCLTDLHMYVHILYCLHCIMIALHCAALQCTAWHCALALNHVTGTHTRNTLRSPSLWCIFEANLGTQFKMPSLMARAPVDITRYGPYCM